ncbi:MAG: hypothetical protein AB9866_14270 [Syntrophobacteraceae bacterium]
MLIRHKKTFSTGVLFSASFLVVLLVIFSPIFGNGRNGLVYSDDLFNSLSKGSSYFIGDVRKDVQPFNGQALSTSIASADQELAIKMLMTAGMQVGTADNQLKITGDLGKLLESVLNDSDSMFHNKAADVAGRYGLTGDAGQAAKKATKNWWAILNAMVKDLQFQKKIDQAKITDRVLKKGIEPAYNFFGVEAESVASKAGVMISLLVFYVVYTMWWGYGIFYMFDGIGLSMKKAKVKKEV